MTLSIRNEMETLSKCAHDGCGRKRAEHRGKTQHAYEPTFVTTAPSALAECKCGNVAWLTVMCRDLTAGYLSRLLVGAEWTNIEEGWACPACSIKRQKRYAATIDPRQSSF